MISITILKRDPRLRESTCRQAGMRKVGGNLLLISRTMVYEYYKDFSSKDDVLSLLSTAVQIEGDVIKTISNKELLQTAVIYQLAFNASVNKDETIKKASIHWINQIAKALEIVSTSNFDFYQKKAAGEHQFFTVPAINGRMVAFHLTRAAVSAADKLGLPHLIFELALSEGGYTGQKKNEYAALVKAAYISLGLQKRELHLQADHYQLDPKKYEEDADKELQRIKDATEFALEQEVYNIDIDASKFETDDPSKSDRENQEVNAKLAAEVFAFIRQYEQEHNLPCTISIGGEVGEVGGENTKYPQVIAYMEMVKEHLESKGLSKAPGFSKISINVGSAHGGVLGEDGKPLDTVPLDFQAHHDLYMKGKDPFNKGQHILGVQHGASTLPKTAFQLFPAMHVAEIHLATGFQNVIWDTLEQEDNPLFTAMSGKVDSEFGEKVKAHKTPAIGFMKERKRVTQFFKRQLLLSKAIPAIEKNLEAEFTTIFHSLYTVLQPKAGHIESGDRED